MSRAISAFALGGLLLNSSAPARADDAEDKAVKFVERLGGKVIRDGKQPGKPVIGVDLIGTMMTDAGLKELATLTNLTVLHLGGTKATDAEVKELQKALPKCKILK
jgi:internalin A